MRALWADEPTGYEGASGRCRRARRTEALPAAARAGQRPAHADRRRRGRSCSRTSRSTPTAGCPSAAGASRSPCRSCGRPGRRPGGTKSLQVVPYAVLPSPGSSPTTRSWASRRSCSSCPRRTNRRCCGPWTRTPRTSDLVGGALRGPPVQPDVPTRHPYSPGTHAGRRPARGEEWNEQAAAAHSHLLRAAGAGPAAAGELAPASTARSWPSTSTTPGCGSSGSPPRAATSSSAARRSPGRRRPRAGTTRSAGPTGTVRCTRPSPATPPRPRGTSLLERTYDSILSGQDDRFAFRHAKDVLTGQPRRGGDVITTIDAKAQKAAYKGLTDLGARGAVVALDPRTGKVLSLVSTPSYNPEVFAGITFKESERFTALEKKKGKPLANRPLRGDVPARLHLQDPHGRGGLWNTGSSPTWTPGRTPSRRTRCRSPPTRSAARRGDAVQQGVHEDRHAVLLQQRLPRRRRRAG